MIGKTVPRRRKRMPRHHMVGLLSGAVLLTGIVPLFRATFAEVKLTSIAPPLVGDGSLRNGFFGAMGGGQFSLRNAPVGRKEKSEGEMLHKPTERLLRSTAPLRVRLCDVPLRDAVRLLLIAGRVPHVIQGEMPQYVTWDTKDREQSLSIILSEISQPKKQQGALLTYREENAYLLVSSSLSKKEATRFKREEDPLPYRLAGTIQRPSGEMYGLLEVRTKDKITFMTVLEGTVITLEGANTNRVVALTPNRITIADRHSTIQEYPLRGLVQEQRKAKDL